MDDQQTSKKPEEELEETVKRLAAGRGVVGVLILTAEDGAVIRSTLPAQQTAAYATSIAGLLPHARTLASLTSKNENLILLRLGTLNYELMIVPEEKYIMVALKALH